jgi:hypothetical protein
MFALPGIAALMVFIYVRPHEIFDWLHFLSFPTVLGVAVVGLVIDWRIAASRPRVYPLIVVSVLFFAWAAFTVVVKVPVGAGPHVTLLVVSLLLFLVTAFGAPSIRGFQALATMTLAMSIFLAAVGVQQGLSPRVCIIRNDAADGGPGSVVSDGRGCTARKDCYENGEPETEYLCERTGLFGTASVGGRVRYRGILQDPNELAWAISIGLPFAFVFQQRRRSATRLALLIGAVALAIVCVVMTQSRSGQLALLAVVGAYFIRRFGWKGIVAAGLLSVPLILFGGRVGEEADSSTTERLDCWEAGLGMFRTNPVLGVGAGQFADHHYLTAHNSFVLTLAELGPLGMFLWSCAFYLVFKILVQALRDFADNETSAIVARWAMALIASLAGSLVSSFFLSIAYHPVLWVQFGLVAAFYGAIHRHAPHWWVRFGWRDVLLIAGTDIMIITAIYGYVRMYGE